MISFVIGGKIYCRGVIMNILLAEDDIQLGELTAHLLMKKAGFKVDWITDGESAYDYAISSHYDVIVLDWMMPKKSGVDVCRQLRKEGYTGAILILTAKDAVENRVEGLDSGADDYVVKPFEIDELLARIRALSRRNFAPIVEEVVTLQDDITVNRTSHTIHSGQEEVQLSPREYQLLNLLLQNKGRVLTREIILDRIWGYDSDVSYKTVDATIKLLRKKLEIFDKHDLIQSIRGVGYKIDE